MILASSSPQRKQLIKYIAYETQCLSVETDETFDEKLSVYDNVMNVAKNKALAVIKEFNIDNELVIGCDTVVCKGEEVLVKPVDYNDAYNMIMSYNNVDTEIVSGVCVAYVKNGEVHTETFIETSWVKFSNVTPLSVKAWLEEGDYLGCSGGIKIEKIQNYFDVEIEGSISNIIGLPLEKLTTLYLAYMSDDRFPTLYEDRIETPITRTRSTSRVIPYDGENVYLLKQQDRSGDIGYTLIGGGCTIDEDILEAGRREVLEEAGFVLGDVNPIGASYIYHERKDNFLGYDKYWVHHFISYGNIVEFKENERLEYEVDMIKGIEKCSIDDAIALFKDQEDKYKNAENTFFYWFNLGVVPALEILKIELKK